MVKQAVDSDRIADAIHHYKALRLQQILLMYPGKELIVRHILSQLDNSRRIVVNQETGIVGCNEEWARTGNHRCELAFWVLLDFWDKVTFHVPGTDAVTVTAFTTEGEYDLIVIEPGTESSVCQQILPLRAQLSDKVIVILKSEEQIPMISIPDILAFCIVKDNGQTTYYTKPKGDSS